MNHTVENGNGAKKKNLDSFYAFFTSIYLTEEEVG